MAEQEIIIESNGAKLLVEYSYENVEAEPEVGISGGKSVTILRVFTRTVGMFGIEEFFEVQGYNELELIEYIEPKI